MRISDWSSDVCSSDLLRQAARQIQTCLLRVIERTVEPQCLRIGEAKRAMEMTEVLADRERRRGEQPGPRIGFAHALEIVGNFDRRCVAAAAAYQRFDRSEERREGKEDVSTCRSRGSPYH